MFFDTNVLSEALKPAPAPQVLSWLAAQEAFLYGMEALPAGKRRQRLLVAVERMLAELFQGRVLPFDESAAREFAAIVAARDRAGRPISQFDAMIAAIARSRQGTVATRKTTDLGGCGVDLIDPWAA